MTQDILPCGRPVHALPSAGSPTRELDHSADAIRERIAWQRERFQVGTIVRRDDGCVVRITSFGDPSVGGYIEAYGDVLDRTTLEPRGGSNWHTGSLTKVEIVAQPGEKLPGFSWLPSTEAAYDESLYVVPPAAQRRGMFLLGEPMDNLGHGGATRWRTHSHHAGKYWVGSRPITKAEFAQL